MNKQTNFKKQLDREIIKRIQVIENASYDHGPPLTKVDFAGILIVFIICIFGLIWGLY